MDNSSASESAPKWAKSLLSPEASHIKIVNYQSEDQMPDIMQLIQKDLSEPYSIYTYRYFINDWGKLCFLAYDREQCIGAIVCKLDIREQTNSSDPQPIKGYIAMLAVKEGFRKLKIGSELVRLAVIAMKAAQADEIALETEITNHASLKLYENLGFLRDKRLFRYYLNGLDALRLKLWLTPKSPQPQNGSRCCKQQCAS